MTLADDQIQTGRTLAEARPADSRPVVRHRFVGVCLVLALIAVVPGLMGRFGVAMDASTPYGAALTAFWRELDDIRFGSGLRFWLGVGGATTMALLLLYPIRKVLAGRRFLGSVGAWFKLHLLIGIFAPVAILYHTNFSHGGMNANVALWTMLAVAGSGLVGHFVYARASAGYWGDKQTARRNLDGALSLISSLNGQPLLREKLATKLEAFDAEQVTPRKGIRASLTARFTVAQRKRALIQEGVWVVDEAAREMRLDQRLHAETRQHVAKLLHAYFAFAGRAANRSVGEQIWARWRLFHLPLFLVMCVATGLHVVAVWDMDGPAPAERTPATVAPPAAKPITKDTVASARSGPMQSGSTGPIQQVRRATVAVDAAAPTTPDSVAAVQPVKRTPAAKPVETAQATAPPPQLPPPRAAVRTPPPEPQKLDAPKSENLAQGVAVAPPKPNANTEDSKALFDEVKRRTETDGPLMGLGKPRSLEQQIEAFKAKQRTREFKHSDAETGFALTGKHTRADCSDCHTVPLKEVRSETPRDCVACHKKDDVHKGRRPDCADCHTTNSFRDRKKKR